MNFDIQVIHLLVDIIQTVLLGFLSMSIMAMYKENYSLAKEASDKVEKVRESLEVSSTTLAQESTLKNLERKQRIK